MGCCSACHYANILNEKYANKLSFLIHMTLISTETRLSNDHQKAQSDKTGTKQIAYFVLENLKLHNSAQTQIHEIKQYQYRNKLPMIKHVVYSIKTNIFYGRRNQQTSNISSPTWPILVQTCLCVYASKAQYCPVHLNSKSGIYH